jgi:DNA-binding SARP family transcriptional activator
LEFRILGPLDVVGPDGPEVIRGTKRRGLLAYLLVHAGEAVSLDRLAEDLYDERSSAGARGTVQTYLSQLRKLLADRNGVTLETRPSGYVLGVSPDSLDAARFERLCAQAATEADASTRLAMLDAALDLWRGAPLGEFAGSTWADVEAARIDAVRLQALRRRIDARLDLGHAAETIPELERLAGEHPLDEHFWAQLMVAYYRAGRQADALRAYQRARSLLAEELGVDPAAELQDLERRILDHDPELMLAHPEPGSTNAGLPEGVVTFLLTDIEGSTTLWDHDPDAMSLAIARHEELISRTVREHGGWIVKSRGEGDSTLSVFPRASDAAAAAFALQRELFTAEWPGGLRLATRLALHTGEAHLREGDYYGGTLNRAARIRALASGGQAVCSRPTRDLIADTLPDEVQLIELGTHALRGLQRPEHVYELAISGLPSQFPPLQSVDAFPGAISLPGPAFVHTDEELAGRDVEMQRLEGVWKEAGTGILQVALVSGEPGIGKTRLASEFSQLVHARGGVALYGRCDEDAIVPYQPFVEALRPYVRATSASLLRERLHGLEYDLGRVFPELLGRLPEIRPPIQSDPETERYRLFEAITSLLTGISASCPTVLVLDDLHWADKPTLQLFRHVVRAARHAALLVLACYLDVELEEDDWLPDVVADLRRESCVTSMSLHGLSEADSGELVDGLAARDVPRPLVRALHRETDGNPFFLEEVVRHLIETDRSAFDRGDAQQVSLEGLDLPERIREVVARRLRRMPSQVNDVLSLGAVVGTEFDAALIGRASEQSPEAVLELLEQATRAGLVHERVDQAGRYVFAHALIRQTLYAGLRAGQRAKLHARVGGTIEASGGEHAAAALAQHYTRALPLVGAEKAIEYTTKAGHEAVADLALEDAVAYFERALHLLEQYAPTDGTQRVELLTDLAEALVNVDDTAGVHAALRAVDAARANGSPEQFGRAAAVFAEPNSAVLLYPNQVDTLLDEAQQAIGDDHPSLRARLMAIEAFKYSSYQLQGRDGRALADRAVQLARDAADTSTLTAALFARAMSLESTDQISERLALGKELVALGRAGGSRAAMATAQGLRVLAGVHLEVGDAESLSSTIAKLSHAGEQLRWLPALVFEAQWRATQALLEGRFEDVRARWNDMRRYARAYRAVAGIEAQQAYYLAREQGDLAVLLGPLERIAAGSSESLYGPAMLAVAQLDTADETAALRTLNSLTVEDIRRSETESAGGAVLALLAEVAAGGASKSHAALLYDLLNPFAGRLLAAVIGLACLGAAERFQGMLSTTLERWDDAEAHFERALELEQRIRGHALVPRTRYWQAQFLRARARPGDDRTARAILGEVAKDTRELGMRRLSEQAEQLLAR